MLLSAVQLTSYTLSNPQEPTSLAGRIWQARGVVSCISSFPFKVVPSLYTSILKVIPSKFLISALFVCRARREWPRAWSREIMQVRSRDYLRLGPTKLRATSIRTAHVLYGVVCISDKCALSKQDARRDRWRSRQRPGYPHIPSDVPTGELSLFK